MGVKKLVRGHEINYESAEQKILIEEAASRSGLTPTAFIRSAAIGLAEQKLKQDQILLLSDEGWDQLMELEANPPEPNEAIKKLFSR